MSCPRKNSSTSGFSVIEVMVASTVMVVGLLAVMSSTATTQLLRKRSLDEDRVFRSMVARIEQCRGDLFRDTPFQDAVEGAIAADGSYSGSFVVDLDGDGVQDVSAAPGDSETPALTVAITVPDDPGDPNTLLQVEVQAQWYGIGGMRTRTIRELVANRTGFGG